MGLLEIKHGLLQLAESWTEFVASRLKEDFKKKSENGKEKQKKHKYNHITFRKGYANLMEELKASSSNQINRSIVWKQARMDHPQLFINTKGGIENSKELVEVGCIGGPHFC
uniref:Uncharacterized protein n=1 Tax=Cucumis melo TaxID=3656 RepID=A0A9I9EF83_CUCME